MRLFVPVWPVLELAYAHPMEVVCVPWAVTGNPKVLPHRGKVKGVRLMQIVYQNQSWSDAQVLPWSHCVVEEMEKTLYGKVSSVGTGDFGS